MNNDIKSKFDEIEIKNSNNELTLGDKQKQYEKILDFNYPEHYPVIIRLDGKGFSKRSKSWKLKKPFDSAFTQCMNAACQLLFKELQNVQFIWCGSDEISIVLENDKAEGLYSRRLSKLLSISASIATVGFNQEAKKQKLNVDDYPAYFDARMTILPNKDEVFRNILFRQNDCIRNSISQYADMYYSNKELHKKTSNEKIEMMLKKGFDWENDVPPVMKYGFLLSKIYRIFDLNTKEYINSVEELDDSINYEELGQYIRTGFVLSTEKITKEQIMKFIN
jgi:tRNA(His) 5'-end guanylyltransferase